MEQFTNEIYFAKNINLIKIFIFNDYHYVHHGVHHDAHHGHDHYDVLLFYSQFNLIQELLITYHQS